MDEQEISGYIMATEGCGMILMTSKYLIREHECTGPGLAVKGDAGYFAT
jgi:hypothetical protein